MFQQAIDEAAEASRQAARKVLALQTAPLAEAEVATDVLLSTTSFLYCDTNAALRQP